MDPDPDPGGPKNTDPDSDPQHYLNAADPDLTVWDSNLIHVSAGGRLDRSQGDPGRPQRWCSDRSQQEDLREYSTGCQETI